MSYSTDPVADAAAYYEPRDDYAERQAQAEHDMAQAFQAACQRRDANALASFAPMTTDWDAVQRQPHAFGTPTPKRRQTLTEVMEEALEYRKGPSKTELMQLLLNVAYGADLADAPAQARYLIQRMAHSFAGQNAELED